ncbi:MAG: hypothetical protein CVV42_08920 [Candidatus Riflebacteria bacterium HGW-Riflebacteria-2]|jgi:hypothetical protein|nr:MAG: hypothetical protein CVV42_08920 [Candidatus Riflebacteria bacterium HGW-Riflebacteria-2]
MFHDDELELVLEELLDEPFMAITEGQPNCCFGQEVVCGRESDEIIVWLQIDQVKTEIIDTFISDYMSIGRDFACWAKSRGFIDCQILGGDDNTLVFAVNAFMK